MSTVESLEKCLSDLVANRGRLDEQIKSQELQLDVNRSQLSHFDVLIASVRSTLGDASAIAKVDELLVAGVLQEEPASDPLANAGAGAQNTPAPAAEVGS